MVVERLFHDEGHDARFSQGLRDEGGLEWLDCVGFLLDAQACSAVDQNTRRESVPWHETSAFGIREWVCQPKLTDQSAVSTSLQSALRTIA
jgi:hypothetical protein